MPKRAPNEPDDQKDKPSVMSGVPISRRSEKGNEIVRKKFESLGFICVKPEKRCQDMICIKGEYRLPVQAKPIPLTRKTPQTCVDPSPLKEFVGLYPIWVERRGESDGFLYIPDPIFRSIMNKRKPYSSGKIRPHKDRRFLYVPRSLKGFERFADDGIPDRYCQDKEKLLKELGEGNSE